MTAAEVRYGHWPSPITADSVAAAGTSYDEALFAGSTLCWLEGRSDRSGGSVLVCWDQTGGVRDILPEWANVESEIYGFGSGAWAAAGGSVWFCDAAGQRIRCLTAGSAADPTLLLDTACEGIRYGDLQATPDGHWLVCVREHAGRHEQGGPISSRSTSAAVHRSCLPTGRTSPPAPG